MGSAAAGAPRKTPPKPQPKIDPIEALVLMQEANRHREGENLAEACAKTNFKGLSYALTLNSDWLTREKGEFETS
jgi:hypothetical protein